MPLAVRLVVFSFGSGLADTVSADERHDVRGKATAEDDVRCRVVVATVLEFVINGGVYLKQG